MVAAISFFVVGVVLFLFAMIKLGEKVQRLFTARFRQYIRYAVHTPLHGLITGIFTTVLFQSSSTTTALIVGMVSAGLISFYHSLGMILGADIGTTLTVQLVVWKVTDVAPLFVVVGGIPWLFGSPRYKRYGEPIFYFGLILFSLSLIGKASAPLRESTLFVSIFRDSRNLWLGLAAGAAFTAIVHASAIPISILVLLGQQDLISLENAIPILFGANIGTTVTAVLASLVANVNGKRSAAAHLLFKVCGVGLCMVGLPLFVRAVAAVSGSVPQQVAIAHFLLNLIIAVVSLPLLTPVSHLIERMLPGRAEVLPIWPEFLKEECLARTEEALACVRKELWRQMGLARRMFAMSMELITRYDRGKSRDIRYIEAVVHNLRREVGKYLWRVSSKEFSNQTSRELFAYTAMVDDIERIADHAVVLADLSREKYRLRTDFSERGWEELAEIERLVGQNLEDAAVLIEGKNEGRADAILRHEDAVDQRVREAREHHLERFHRRVCRAEAGPIFLEVLINLERVSDHCTNIAEYVLELESR